MAAVLVRDEAAPLAYGMAPGEPAAALPLIELNPPRVLPMVLVLPA